MSCIIKRLQRLLHAAICRGLPALQKSEIEEPVCMKEASGDRSVEDCINSAS